MPLTQKTDGRFVRDDMIFDMFDEQMGVVRVTVEREALDDFCGHRGIVGISDEIWEYALSDILVTASDKYDRDGGKPRHILVQTTDLNH